MSSLYFFDTNILMYAVGAAHPLKRPCLELLQQVSEGLIQAVTDTEVFQEVAYRYWSQRKWSIAVDVLELYQDLFDEVYPIEKQHLSLYYQLLSDYTFLSPRDAIHVAVMKLNGIRNLYTADKALARIPFIKVHGPCKP